MHWIPDVPQNVKDQIERENIITQKAIWKTKQLLPLELNRVRESSNAFLDNLNSNTDRIAIDEITEHNYKDGENSTEKENLLN